MTAGLDLRDTAKRCIVYTAWGEASINQAARSARTTEFLRVERCLITNEESLEFVEPGAPFERILKLQFKLPGLLAKTEVFDLLPPEYNSFALLDADTWILLDIMQGYERAEKFGMAAAPAPHYSLDGFWGFKAALDRFGFLSRDILQYNSGVLFFTRTPKVWEVLKKWHELCASAASNFSQDQPPVFLNDQPYLTLAMELLAFNPYTLSIAYNYRNVGELVSGKIRIWHSRTQPPADVNAFEPTWPNPHRFRNGKRLQEVE